MSTKHFFHEADSLVLDSLESLTISNPTLKFDKTNKGMHATFRRKLQRTLTDLRYTAIFLSGHDPSSTVALYLVVVQDTNQHMQVMSAKVSSQQQYQAPYSRHQMSLKLSIPLLELEVKPERYSSRTILEISSTFISLPRKLAPRRVESRDHCRR